MFYTNNAYHKSKGHMLTAGRVFDMPTTDVHTGVDKPHCHFTDERRAFLITVEVFFEWIHYNFESTSS